MAQRPPWETYNLPPWARAQHLYTGGPVRPTGNFGDWWNTTTGMNPDAGKPNQNGQYPSTPGWTPGQTSPPEAPPRTNQPMPGSYNSSTPSGESFNVPTGQQPGQDSGMFGTGGYKVNADNYTLPGFQQFNNQTSSAADNALGHRGPQLNGRPQGQFRGQQQVLANTLLDQARGKGPSVAQEMLKQQTNNNIANQFALAQANPNNGAGLRSMSTNIGNLNQEAAGQGALARAQETMNAESQLGGVLQSGRQQDIGFAGDNANLSEQGFRDANAAGIGFMGENLKGREAEQRGTMQMGSDEAKAYEAAAANKQKIWGGLLGGISGAGAGMMKGMGGGMGGSMGGGGSTGGDTSENPGDGGDAGDGGGDGGADGGGDGGGEYSGGEIPGHAKSDGDSPSNDTVPTMLSPGEVVLPRSVTQAEDSPEKAAAFLEAMKKGKKPKPTFADVLTYQRKMHGRLQELEKLCYGGMVK